MRSLRAVLIGGALALVSASAMAQEAEPPAKQDWGFYGVLGTFDRAATQRGFQVYREVCAACHGLSLVSYRELAGIGYSEAAIKAIAASVQVPGEPNDTGDIEDRPGRPSDRFKSPFPNAKAAAAANGGATPPDLSLIVKGRKYGPDYVYAILTGYRDPPSDFKLGDGMHYNAAFPGHQIAMPAPLTDDRVSYADGTKASIAQEAHDVVTFLAWAADPHLEDRHKIGFRVVLFLGIFSAMMYGVKRKIWSKVH